MKEGIVKIGNIRMKCLIVDKLQEVKIRKTTKGKERTYIERRLQIYIPKKYISDYYIIIPVKKSNVIIHDENNIEIIQSY